MEMKHFIMDAELILEENSYGIPEPKSGNMGSFYKIEVILVPLLAADRSGNRIGYGKGFYDRLLADIKDDVLKIGLCIGPLFDRFDFVEPHDIKLDYCITPFETVKY